MARENGRSFANREIKVGIGLNRFTSIRTHSRGCWLGNRIEGLAGASSRVIG
jgi:hypothetical protein